MEGPDEAVQDSSEEQKGKAKPGAVPQDQDRAHLVSGMRKDMGNKLTQNEYKPSVGDYLKLLQMEQELESQETKEIRVTWVETEKSKTEK